MSDFRPMTECKGFNIERVLLKNTNGYMITACFKDGMLKCDGDEEWTHPIVWKGFIRLRDLTNGVDASKNTLPIQNVSGMYPADFIEWMWKYKIGKQKINGTEMWYSGNFYGRWETIDEMYKYFLKGYYR